MIYTLAEMRRFQGALLALALEEDYQLALFCFCLFTPFPFFQGFP